jgi:hypothetical protein
MQKIIFIDETGKTRNGYIQNDPGDAKSELLKDEKRKNFKEHLYMTYLIFGTFAFAFGIYISLRRLKASK